MPGFRVYQDGQVNRDNQESLATQESAGGQVLLVSAEHRASADGLAHQAQMAHLGTQASVDGPALRAWGHRDTQE